MLSRRVPARLPAGGGLTKPRHQHVALQISLQWLHLDGTGTLLGGAAGCKDQAEENRAPSGQQAREVIRGVVIAL